MFTMVLIEGAINIILLSLYWSEHRDRKWWQRHAERWEKLATKLERMLKESFVP